MSAWLLAVLGLGVFGLGWVCGRDCMRVDRDRWKGVAERQHRNLARIAMEECARQEQAGTGGSEVKVVVKKGQQRLEWPGEGAAWLN